jgi:hypothetical protein
MSLNATPYILCKRYHHVLGDLKVLCYDQLILFEFYKIYQYTGVLGFGLDQIRRVPHKLVIGG